jgi:Family of unknown function (DUF6516)
VESEETTAPTGAPFRRQLFLPETSCLRSGHSEIRIAGARPLRCEQDRAGVEWAVARFAGSREYADILHWLSVADNLVMMKGRGRDSDDDVLLDLDGQVFVVDTKGQYWVRFSVRRAPAAPDRPHGLRYSLTLHGPDGSRLVGFDNAHAVRESQGPGGKSQGPRDHRHRMETIRPYRFKDAATLLEDFWAEVDGVLREKGVI